MASIGGVSGSNTTSSLYNSANVISGLASGLDTESMIEGLVQSYQTKIQNLTNKATKIEWKQEAYRSIINKMYAFSNKYTSYSSSTNLMSASFFNSAIKVASMGANKDAVSASGRTDSDIKVNSVKQLATSARYSTAGSFRSSGDDFAVMAENAVKFSDEFDTGALSGSLTLNYGGKTVSVVFDPSKDIIADKVYKTNADGSYQLDENGKRIVERQRTSQEKAEDLKNLIEKKLGDSKITLSSGETRAATDLIDVKLSGGQISFKDKSTGGNDVYISSASDSVKNTLGLDLDDAKEKKPSTITVPSNASFTNTEDVGSYISGARMNLSLDGKTKSITLPTIRKTNDGYEIQGEDGKYTALTGDKYAEAVQKALNKEFGEGKITVSNEGGADALQLKFQAQDNSDLVINSDVGKALGIGNVATNYLNTSKTLGELLEDSAWDGLTAAKGYGLITEKDGKRVDQNGQLVNEAGNLIDKDGNELYAFKVNGVTIGNYNKDSKLSTVLSDLNANSEAGVKASYSQTTRKFTFTTKDTGSENGITFDGLAKTMFGPADRTGEKTKDILGEDIRGKTFSLEVDGNKVEFQFESNEGTLQQALTKINGKLAGSGITASISDVDGSLTFKKGDEVLKATYGDDDEIAQKLAGKLKTATYTEGQDAILSVEINGEEMEMTRGSNSFSLDGMTLNLKSTFNEDYVANSGTKPATEAVTFQRSTDSDKIVDAVKSMIADYNEMMSEIRTQYATLPYQNSSGAFQTYEPLSDEDKATMSESAIQKYEEKAKQGILFGDRDLSSLYEKMRSVFSPGGSEEALLQQMGISVGYSSGDGSSYITLDESKLRSMLDSDPDAVADMFTRSASSGSASDGIMQKLKTQLDRYGSTTGATKGILVEQAGTPLSSLTLMSNNWQKQIDNVNDEITKWQDKLSAQVDKYTSMFSKLETLIYQMNSQSSTLAGLMGG